MTTGNWFEIALAAVSLILVGISAWVEISLSTVHRLTIRELLEDRLGKIQEELDEASRLRSAMLLIELIGVGASTALITFVLVDTGFQYGLLVGIVLATVLNIVIGRIFPRVIAGESSSHPSSVALSVGRVLNSLFKPLILPVDAIGHAFMRPDSRDVEAAIGDNGNSTLDALHEDYHTGLDGDQIEADEHEMLAGVLQLDTATAHDIMVPRVDLVTLPENATITEAVGVTIQAGHSRIPVYGESVDEIVGILYAKDLLRYVTADHENVTVKSLVRAPHIVPEIKPLDDLLQELQQAKIHMAVVVDEYGGTAGVVTIEDILEEIVGEIEDEYDHESPLFEIVNGDVIIVDGRFMVDDVTDHFGLHLEDRPSGTVSGLIQRELGHIPESGESVEAYGLVLTVLESDRQRVLSVRCTRGSSSHPLVEAANNEASATGS